MVGRRVGLAGGEDAVAVGLAPVRDPGPAAGGDQDGVGLELLDAVVGLGHHLVGALEPAGAADHPDALAVEQLGDLCR